MTADEDQKEIVEIIGSDLSSNETLFDETLDNLNVENHPDLILEIVDGKTDEGVNRILIRYFFKRRKLNVNPKLIMALIKKSADENVYMGIIEYINDRPHLKSDPVWTHELIKKKISRKIDKLVFNKLVPFLGNDFKDKKLLETYIQEKWSCEKLFIHL